jgi:hypothetical protein
MFSVTAAHSPLAMRGKLGVGDTIIIRFWWFPPLVPTQPSRKPRKVGLRADESEILRLGLDDTEAEMC